MNDRNISVAALYVLNVLNKIEERIKGRRWARLIKPAIGGLRTVTLALLLLVLLVSP